MASAEYDCERNSAYPSCVDLMAALAAAMYFVALIIDEKNVKRRATAKAVQTRRNSTRLGNHRHLLLLLLLPTFVNCPVLQFNGMEMGRPALQGEVQQQQQQQQYNGSWLVGLSSAEAALPARVARTLPPRIRAGVPHTMQTQCGYISRVAVWCFFFKFFFFVHKTPSLKSSSERGRK